MTEIHINKNIIEYIHISNIYIFGVIKEKLMLVYYLIILVII